MKTIALFLLSTVLWAHTSVDINAVGASTFITNSLLTADEHWDMRLSRATSGTLPASEQYFWDLSGCFEITIDASGNIFLHDNVDTFTGGANSYASLTIPSGSTDFMIRAQRCTESDAGHCTWIGGPFLELEVWNIDGTGYNSNIAPISTVNALPSGAGTTLVLVGNSGSFPMKLAYFRWCSGTTPMSTNVSPTQPPYPNANAVPATCTPIVDWEFESSPGYAVDSGPNSVNLSTITAGNTVSTPTPAPGCALPIQVFSTTLTATLSSATCGSTQDSATLTYSWSYLGAGTDGVTQTPTFSSTSVASPTVTGLIRGSFNVQLAVTDSGSQTSTVSVHDGAVVTDANHIISSMGNANIDRYYMPMIQHGYNPYPYFDHAAITLANNFGALQSTTYAATWMTPVAGGTVDCTNGSSACTIHTTNAQTEFCGGGSSGGTTYIIVYHTTGGVTYHSVYPVYACPTTSSITLGNIQTGSGTANYRDATVSGTQFSIMFANSSGAGGDATWVGSSNNADYYDNVAAFMGLYYRTGIDTYYTYGHTLGMSWWTMPWNDQGLSCNGAYPCIVSVSARDGTLGLVTLALDGTISGFVTQIQMNWEAADTAAIPTGPPLVDLRVSSLHLARMAYWSFLDATNRAALVSSLGTSTAFLSTYQGTGIGSAPGSLVNLSFGHGTVNGDPGTVAVSNASPTVSGTSTNFNSFSNTNDYFVTVGTNTITCTSGDNFDTLAYFQPTVNSATSLTLLNSSSTPVNYAGGFPGSGRYWQMGNITGCGEQPFMNGFFMHAGYYVNLALTNGGDSTNAAKMKTLILNASGWMTNTGLAQTSAAPAPVGLPVNGIFYARGFVESEPNPWADYNNWCQAPATSCSSNNAGLIGNLRFLSAETMSGMAFARVLGDTSTTPATLYSANYGCLGGTNADKYCVAGYLGSPQFNSPDYYPDKAKDFGFVYGWGNGAIWPAVSAAASSAGSSRGNSRVGGPVRTQ